MTRKGFIWISFFMNWKLVEYFAWDSNIYIQQHLAQKKKTFKMLLFSETNSNYNTQLLRHYSEVKIKRTKIVQSEFCTSYSYVKRNTTKDTRIPKYFYTMVCKTWLRTDNNISEFSYYELTTSKFSMRVKHFYVTWKYTYSVKPRVITTLNCCNSVLKSNQRNEECWLTFKAFFTLFIAFSLTRNW